MHYHTDTGTEAEHNTSNYSTNNINTADEMFVCFTDQTTSIIHRSILVAATLEQNDIASRHQDLNFTGSGVLLFFHRRRSSISVGVGCRIDSRRISGTCILILFVFH